MDVTGFFENNFKDLLYIVGAIISFLVGKQVRRLNIKKQTSDIQSAELDNVEAALKIYRTMLNDLQEKLKEVELAADLIEKRYHKTVEEKQALIEENIRLKQQIHDYKTTK